MNSVDTAQDQAVLWTLDFDAELPCEARHGESKCSGPATHWFDSCDAGYVVCKNAAKLAVNFIDGCWRTHDTCQKLCAECWSIRPI